MWNFQRNSPLLLATALRLLKLLCTDPARTQSGKYLLSVSGEPEGIDGLKRGHCVPQD
jgi:hypothetical protein